MICKKVPLQITGLALIVLLLVGCSTAQTEPDVTEVPLPPTSTPIPSTPTCSVDCAGGEITITCESGLASYKSFCRQETTEIKAGVEVWARLCDVTATYEESANVYEFDAVSFQCRTSDGEFQDCVEVTVTGGVFGDDPQYCQNY